jgi:hypothetical protein
MLNPAATSYSWCDLLLNYENNRLALLVMANPCAGEAGTPHSWQKFKLEATVWLVMELYVHAT